MTEQRDTPPETGFVSRVPVTPVSQSMTAWRRIAAMILRYSYLIKGSWPRLLDLWYWPTLQIVLWGFITGFLVENSSFFAQATGILLGAVMLWDLLFRGQMGFALSFFEEMWSRNLGHLLVSPLRPRELIAALLAMSVIRTIVGVAPATVLAIWFFGFNLYALGLMLIAFFICLIMAGWSMGLLVSGLVLRFGMGAESLAWALIFGIAPLCAIYYPVASLPDWIQPLSWALPPSHIFEGMRAILIDQTVRYDLLLSAILLDLAYFSAACWWFMHCLKVARNEGKLLQIGE
jgi:ABC-2 type transport system permease protein